MGRGVELETICTGETYKSVVTPTFARGASLQDPSGLFNAGLEGNTAVPSIFMRMTGLMKCVEGCHSRRRGTEHVDASHHSPYPLLEETEEA